MMLSFQAVYKIWQQQQASLTIIAKTLHNNISNDDLKKAKVMEQYNENNNKKKREK